MPIEPDGLGATRDEYFFLALGQRDDGDALRLGQLAERFLAAGADELAAVPGLPEKTARQVYAQLHKTGGA